MPNPYEIGLTVTLPSGHYTGTYTLRLEDVSGLDDQDCYRETGKTVFGHFASLTEETGMGAMVAAVIVWLVRRKQFPHMTYREVAASITWGSQFSLHDADSTEDEGKGPESEDSQET